MCGGDGDVVIIMLKINGYMLVCMFVFEFMVFVGDVVARFGVRENISFFFRG